MSSGKRRFWVGFVQWLVGGLGVLSLYFVELDSFADWDWFVFTQGAIAQAVAGLGMLAAFIKNNIADDNSAVEQPIKPAATAPADDPYSIDIDGLDDHVEFVHPDSVALSRVDSSDHFDQSELECKGVDCGCEYPGMSSVTMEIADEARVKFGKMFVNSGHRCRVHNATIKDASKSSFHVDARAVDIRPAKSTGVTPQELYNWLCEQYPDKYGFGLYETFVHIDDRRYDSGGEPVYGRRGVDGVWRQKRTNFINLA